MGELQAVGWVELLQNPSLCRASNDGFAAQPILRAGASRKKRQLPGYYRPALPVVAMNWGKIRTIAVSKVGHEYRTYFKDGIEQGAVELHLCSFSEALRAMTEHLSDEERKRLTVFRSNNTSRYEFEYE
jgi:hypothetical protein